VYRDFVFVTFSLAARPLEDYLAPVRPYLDSVIDQSLIGQIEVLEGTHFYRAGGTGSSSCREDINYSVEDATAIITIDRPKRYNAFRGQTVEELITAFRSAWADARVRVVILTGAGDKAFCAGGDVKQRAQTGDYGPTKSGMFEIGYLQKLIRDIPKPVIAAVNGAAIGGGHVLHVLCDLSIAADNATFGQAGPRVGSFDAGFGSAFLARVVGEKRAARSGICAGSTTRSPRNGGDRSTPLCPPIGCLTKPDRGRPRSPN
jgi:hypothetical protein